MSTRPSTADLPRLLTALADPTRLRLLHLLRGREVCVCHLTAILRQDQPKVSRHLGYLRRIGIVAARREGKWMHYRLVHPRNAAAASVLDAVLDSLPSLREMQSDLVRLDRICCLPAASALVPGESCCEAAALS